MKAEKLTKEDLTKLSDVILARMNEVANINKFALTDNIKIAINFELETLKKLNSKICKLMS